MSDIPRRNISKLSIILQAAFIILTSLGGFIISAFACFAQPGGSTLLYTLELDVSGVNLTAVFPPYYGYSTYKDTVANYSFENSGLSEIYRIGMFGYCGGAYTASGKFVKDHCTSMDPAYRLNPYNLLTHEVNGNMTKRSSALEDNVDLPESLPSKGTMRRKSLDMYGGTLAGMGLSIWCFLCVVLAFIGMIWGAKTSLSDGSALCVALLLFNFFLCVMWALGSWIALLAGAAGAHPTYVAVTKAFNDDTYYGVRATVGSQFFNLIYGAAVCMIVLWLFIVTTIIVHMRRGKKGPKQTTTSPTRPARVPDIEEVPPSSSSLSESPVKVKSSEKASYVSPALQPQSEEAQLPSYEESQRHARFGMFI